MVLADTDRFAPSVQAGDEGFGSVLFVGTAIGKISITQTMRTLWPFYLAGLLVLALVTLVPALSLWLPSVLR